ncbi:D-galacturonate reductase-like [Phalaenopsis equestris]|uniref:D-galacturonate reductase-like n=1 Tax=Phalaenopsis equestris TaxID=78828 RepID=UPI0009E3458D|nr:D-galacturonate reductase-like [Phalaenopsis equestris]
MAKIPEIRLRDGVRAMPAVGMGTADMPFAPASTKPAILHAIELGYRHFDTATLYETEQPLGEAIAEALRIGLISSRSELFITSKLWCDSAHPQLVVPALQKSLRNLQVDYIDLYLIHMPMSSRQGTCRFPISREDALPLDIKSVWEAMEDCLKLGLTNLIGVSNFSPCLIDKLLLTAKVPPFVNQVEMHPAWQQVKLREYCKEKGIHVTAYSPIGGYNGPLLKNQLMDSDVLNDIAKARGKTFAQICLRWVHQQGVSLVVKSFNKERLKENLQFLDWELSEEECRKISQIPQRKNFHLESILPGEEKLCFNIAEFEFY